MWLKPHQGYLRHPLGLYTAALTRYGLPGPLAVTGIRPNLTAGAYPVPGGAPVFPEGSPYWLDRLFTWEASSYRIQPGVLARRSWLLVPFRAPGRSSDLGPAAWRRL